MNLLEGIAVTIDVKRAVEWRRKYVIK